jgi:predicted nucleic acid-binding protein
MIAVDANVVTYLVTDGPLQSAARALLSEDPGWMAPPLWRSEVRNVLAAHVRQRRLSLAAALAAWGFADRIVHDAQPADAEAVIQAAVESGCSAYDCEYVLAARLLGCKLVTADKQVLRAFPGDTVRLQGRPEDTGHG